MQSSPLNMLALSSLGLLLVANLALQFYVSTRVFRDQGPWQQVAGVMRSTFIFRLGWQRAEELAIRKVMAIWTTLLAALILVVSAVLAPMVVYGPFS